MSTELSRRERNKRDKEERIVAAASKLFETQGYDGTTMAQVADDADVAIGTVFTYASTKPELLMLVTADLWAPVAERAMGEPPTPAAERILTFLDPLLHYSLEQPDVSMAIARELLFGAQGPHRDKVVALVASMEDKVAEVLSEEQAHNAPAAARLVVSGALLECNRTRTGRADQQSAAERLAEVVMLAVGGAEGPTPKR